MVALFTEGLHRDAWNSPMSPDQAHDLVLAPGLIVHPPQAAWQDPTGCRILHLTKDWPDTLSVGLEEGGEPLWTPIMGPTGGSSRLPLEGQNATLLPVPIGNHPKLLLSGLQETVVQVRAAGQKVPFKQNADLVELEAPVPFATSVQVRTLSVDGITRSGRIDIPRTGAQHLGPSGWQTFPVASLDVRDCGKRVRVFVPDMQEPTLRLGHRIIGPCGSHGNYVHLVDGWGAELACSDGRFNRDSSRDTILADHVTDHGAIRNLDLLEQLDGVVSVELRHALSPDAVAVYAVNQSGRPERVHPVPADELTWLLDRTPDCALLIANRNEWIGSWWLQPPEQPTTIQEAFHLLMLLRDSRAPALQREFRRWVSNLIRTFPCAAAVWLLGIAEGTPFPVHTPDADGFASVVRNLLQTWQPDRGSADYLLQSLQKADAAGYDKLTEYVLRAPVPCVRIIRATHDDAARTAILDRLGRPSKASPRILEFMGIQLGVHSAFLKQLGDQACQAESTGVWQSLPEENLLTAMNLSVEYRRWLADRLLTGV